MPSKHKRMFPFLAAVAAAFLFFSCARTPATPLNIADTDVSAGVWAYYLDKTVSKPTAVGLSPMAAKDEYLEKAAELCAIYVAVNTEFYRLGLTLSGESREKITESVNDLWRVYAGHYTSVGVDKQTLTKIQTSQRARDTLFMYYYDTGGEREVPEAALRSYFNNNYVAFRAVNGYFTKTAEDGTVEDLTKAEETALKNKFNAYLERIGEDESIEDIAEIHAAEQGSTFGSAPTGIIRKSNTSYPEGFFEQVSALEPGNAAVLTFDKYLFLVEREDAFTNDEEFYLRYREDCLTALKADEFDGELALVAQGYDIVKNDKVIDNLYKKTHAE